MIKLNYKFKLYKFFKEIKLKKQYVKKLKNKYVLVNNLKIKNYKKFFLTKIYNINNKICV